MVSRNNVFGGFLDDSWGGGEWCHATMSLEASLMIAGEEVSGVTQQCLWRLP